MSKKITKEHILWLQSQSESLDADPEMIQAFPPDVVQEELEEMGIDTSSFIEKIDASIQTEGENWVREKQRMEDTDVYALSSVSSSGQTTESDPHSTRSGNPDPATFTQGPFDPYVLRSLLGHGGMGEVWLAEDTRNNRRVAFKKIQHDKIHEVEAVRRFHREVDIYKRLPPHPHIPRLYDFKVDGLPQSWFMVMELAEAETLADRIRKQKPYSVKETVQFARTTGRVLDHLHRHEIVHRDLTPRNWIHREDGAPMLIDFGVAFDKSRSRLSVHHQAPTTLLYASPEQLNGGPIDFSSDFYQLGLILVFCLTGGVPERPHHRHMRDYIKQRRDDVPALLLDVIERCLAENPKKRFQRAHEFQRALREVNTMSIAGAVSVAAPLRRRLVWMTMGGLMGSVVTLFLVLFMMRGPSPMLSWGSAQTSVTQAWSLDDLPCAQADITESNFFYPERQEKKVMHKTYSDPFSVCVGAADAVDSLSASWVRYDITLNPAGGFTLKLQYHVPKGDISKNL